MSEASLQALAGQLVRRYESKHELRLDGPEMIERFGFGAAKSIEAMLDGRVLKRDLGEILGVVAVLEGEDEDARQLIRVALPMVAPVDDAQVMNERLARRLENMERFLKRIGKLDDFKAWVKEKDSAQEA